MTEKTVYHYDGLEILRKFPKEILPTEYDGTGGSIDELRGN